MKNNLKIGCVVAAMVLLLTACSNASAQSISSSVSSAVDQVQTEQTKPSAKSFYTHGIELISLMKEIAENETYQALLSAQPSIQEMLSPVSEGDYTKPKAVYRVSISDYDFLGMEQSAQIDNLPESLKKQIAAKLQTALIGQVNASDGPYAIAASNICMVEKTFLADAQAKNSLYLYLYEKGAPALVSFVVGEDQTVLASASFILAKEFQIHQQEQVETLAKMFSIAIELVEQ